MGVKWKERITIDKEVLAGKPIIKGTRISVEFILELLANGWAYEDILENYPQLTKEDILSAIQYSLEILKDEKTYAFNRT
ncbi:MAG: DUF433 domain-containing protein [Nitrososphaerales archaeon]|jgi:uncharacterized protein (DUF433 family)